MIIKTMVLGSLGNNTYIVISDDETSAIVVDPSCEPERIMEYLSGRGLKLKAILVTHGHFDHVGAIPKIVEHMKVPVYTHEVEAKIMMDSIKNLSTYFVSKAICAEATNYVVDKEVLDFGDGLSFKVLIVPGHSPKGCCYYNVEDGTVFTGDTLFAGSIGRTDYYNGDSNDLIKHIKEHLMFLPASTKVYPGHGQSTTINNEKTYNPFLK